MKHFIYHFTLKSFAERPAIARGIGTLNYFERFIDTIVLQSFVFWLWLSLQQLLVLANIYLTTTFALLFITRSYTRFVSPLDFGSQWNITRCHTTTQEGPLWTQHVPANPSFHDIKLINYSTYPPRYIKHRPAKLRKLPKTQIQNYSSETRPRTKRHWILRNKKTKNQKTS